jgi:uncharacterized repeat protein (TIGR03803 family)
LIAYDLAVLDQICAAIFCGRAEPMTKILLKMHVRPANFLVVVLAVTFVSSRALRAQQGAIEKTLYSFKGGSGDGDGLYPHAGLVLDAKGNLYGTTYGGGWGVGNPNFIAMGCGTAFKLTPGGKETVLYQFDANGGGTSGTDGCTADAGLILDSSGNLYGVNPLGGYEYYTGVVFKLDPLGNETILHIFLLYSGDGAYPSSTLLRDQSGNLFGTTAQGGATANFGTVFQIDPGGNETLLYSFSGGSDGGNPQRSRLLLDPSGNLYGLTTEGGNTNCNPGGYPPGCGVVFKVTPSGKETVLYTFQGGNDGSFPLGDLVQDGSGNLYGVTPFGGANNNGTVFRLSDNGQFTVLYTFLPGLDGRPESGVILDTAGNLYGVTSLGGTYHRGSVFKLDPSGHRTELWSFTGGPDGGRPWGTLLMDDQGNLYGTTVDGGTGQQGAVFEIIP